MPIGPKYREPRRRKDRRKLTGWILIDFSDGSRSSVHLNTLLKKYDEEPDSSFMLHGGIRCDLISNFACLTNSNGAKSLFNLSIRSEDNE